MHKYCFRLWVVLSCMVVMMIINNNEVVGCLQDEKIALVKLNDSTRIFSSWWDKEVDCCRWEGVTCNPVSKRIINLSPKFLYYPIGNGTLLNSSLFQTFQELQNLTFQAGNITGFEGPLRLPKLQVLNLNTNWLTQVPLIGELPSLKFLDLSNNVMYDEDFHGLKKLKGLELLNLGKCGIKGKIPQSIWALTSLKKLGLFSNMLTGSLPEELCALTNLEELDLSGNEFDEAISACLSNLTSLKLLDLSDNFRSHSNNLYSGTIPSDLFSSLKSLEYVSLSQNYFDGFISFGSFADNSKLEVFDLDNFNPKLKVQTENANWKPMRFQLKVLRLSNCILNDAVGVIPSFLLSQYDLRVVDLSNNGMTGEFPSWLLNNNSKLEYLSLKNNYFYGQLKLQLDARHAYMSWLDVSMNQVSGEIPTFIGSILPNLTYLNMSTNAIRGSIPSFENMRKLKSLDLSNNNLFGKFPRNSFNRCEELQIFKLSNNNLGGNLTNFFLNILGLPQLQVLYLDNNKFSGDLRLETLRLTRGAPLIVLDISNNSITGRFPDWITELSKLATLVLSKNNFEGKLPTSFCKLVNISVLDLSWNNFSDTLPPCINLPLLHILHLQGNGFHGLLPYSLSRSFDIVTLDVTNNKFSGLIPTWIRLLWDLTYLLLQGNLFHGPIPSEICHLENLRILDLAINNLSGSIPPCLSHIPFGKPPDSEFAYYTIFDGIPAALPTSEYSYENQLNVRIHFSENYEDPNVPDEVQLITKSVYESYIRDMLNFMVGIDLSLNKLTGPILMHIGFWDNVHSLNLSYNHFNGSIPAALSSLIHLESLDLSHNMLSGQIPSEMTQLTSLSAFSAAYNNLSGPTPKRSYQFGTFEAKSYEGNPFLCGSPLDKSCSGGPIKMPHTKLFVEPQQNDSSFKATFLWSFFGSFVVSCIGAFVFVYFGTNIPQIVLQWIGIEERIHHRRTIELPWKLINK